MFPRIEVRTGCDGVKPKPKIRVHPVIKLRNYIEKHNIKLIDFFNKIDKDGSMTVSKDEFKRGILVIHKFLPSKQLKPQIKFKNLFKNMGVNLTEDELEQLIKELDSDVDNEINYR